ncbi:MAG: hypothetical protein V3V09_04225 [Arenicellales bacterium]
MNNVAKNSGLESNFGQSKDKTALYSAAFYMANLLFVGVFYMALWLLYIFRYSKSDAITQNHLKQALIASTLSTLLFLLINLVILATGGYDNVRALIALEVYFMAIVPVLFFMGILAFIKALAHTDFRYPLISKFIKLNLE